LDRPTSIRECSSSRKAPYHPAAMPPCAAASERQSKSPGSCVHSHSVTLDHTWHSPSTSNVHQSTAEAMDRLQTSFHVSLPLRQSKLSTQHRCVYLTSSR